LAGLGIGSALLVYAQRPVHRSEGNRQQALAVGAIQNEKIPVAGGLHEHLPRLSMESSVDQHRYLDRIPVVGIVRRGLKGPHQLARIGFRATMLQV
jgi:hypothetical protein